MDPSHQKELTAFKEYLRSRGLKLTSQRNLIAKRIFGTYRPFSTESLLEDLRREKRPISKATVYRTLALLEEADLLSSYVCRRGFRFYEHKGVIAPQNVAQMVCVDCLKVVEINDPELDGLHERIARRLGFRPLSHTYRLHGQCPSCAAPSGVGLLGGDVRERPLGAGRVPAGS